MDDQRFDNLSRIIARSTTRRTTIKGIAAAVGGGVFATMFGVRAQRAGAQGTGEPGDDCANDGECVSGKCSDEGLCYCTDPDRPWIGCECTTGTESPCGGGTAHCCPTGDEPGGPGVCTSGMAECNPTSECVSEPGDTCMVDMDCCTGTCQDGICACSDPDRPWIGCPCSTGTEDPCGGAQCCPTTSTPGGPGVCTSNMATCEPVSECSWEGDGCSTSDDCCSTLVCLDNGTCGTVALPNTGSGSNDGSNTGALIGLAGAAAAAAIAARKLSPKTASESGDR